MKYIYGPVRSRRLGASLGISLTPYKICSFDCVYCQLGRTTLKTSRRQEYLPAQEILAELKSWFEYHPEEAKGLNYLTFAGAGEPTLNLKLGDLIAQIKKSFSVPVAVITNSSLLADSALRQELSAADLVVPTLNAATPEVFQKIGRPQETVSLEGIIEGLVAFRREFRGKLWLEIMLVKGWNDDLRQIKKLKAVVERIGPDKIQLNSPARLAAEPGIVPLAPAKLEKIKAMFGDNCEVV